MLLYKSSHWHVVSYTFGMSVLVVVQNLVEFILPNRAARTMNKTPLQLSFAQRCKELRMHLGMSQEAFANRIGMDRSYYGSIEVGGRNLTLSNLQKIADGFGLTLAELMEGVEA